MATGHGDHRTGKCRTLGRRLVLGAPLLAAIAPAHAEDDAASKLPQRGDLLVYAGTARDGSPVGAEDFGPVGTLLAAWAKDPASGTVRKGRVLQRLLLIRLAPETLDEGTAARAAEGIAGYSAICTHAGCIISEYRARQGVLFCRCHGSMFSPTAGGRVLVGPAKQPLAALPLRAEGGRLLVAGAFEGTPGVPSS